MAALRLRTKILLSMLLVSAGLTCTTLLVVGRVVQKQARQEIVRDLDNSILTFRNVQRQRELTFARAAELTADLPNVRALMTTRDARTIQDASRDLWRLSGSALFILADARCTIIAHHASDPAFSASIAQPFLAAQAQTKSPLWWYGKGHLYQVFLRPIYFGRSAEGHLLGFLALGYEIDALTARDVARIADGDVAFMYAGTAVRSTLPPSQQAELARQIGNDARSSQRSLQVRLGNEKFLATSIDLSTRAQPPVRLSVLKSLDQATAFVRDLNRLLVMLGAIAIIAGGALAYVISNTFTRTLGDLVAGVRALEQGNYTYPLKAEQKDEVAEVANAFDRMRGNLHTAQQELLEAERLATIGNMASSISHDLRHSLAAVVANSEFLCETSLLPEQREELYQEVRVAVNQMTDLIESLMEFSRTRAALHPGCGSVRDSVSRAIQAVRIRRQYRDTSIQLVAGDSSDAWFDARRLERVFFNLLLNACEAAPSDTGRIRVVLTRTDDAVEVTIADNGPGISNVVRDRIFDPFVSYGKENGSGMGLTLAQKIMHDHGGAIRVESTSSAGTVFKLTIPLNLSREKFGSQQQYLSRL
jgi:signal transduction histidine kinase